MPKNYYKGLVTTVEEIPHLSLIAVGSSDKKVTLWNIYKELYVLTIELSNGGVHHI
jgi:hypothetical protein